MKHPHMNGLIENGTSTGSNGLLSGSRVRKVLEQKAYRNLHRLFQLEQRLMIDLHAVVSKKR